MTAHLPILFDCAIAPEWFDFALSNLGRSSGEADFRTLLRDHLAPLIAEPVALRRTVMALQRTVGYRSVLERSTLDDFARRLLANPPDGRTQLRLQVLLAAHPFLADCAAALFRHQQATGQAMALRELIARIESRYGQRGSVGRRVRYALQTLALCGGAVRTGRGWRLVMPSADLSA